MKTKIIYISGNEVFDMADIRVAFDTVRETLGLGHDTVLFGVPVDNDDAFECMEKPQKSENIPSMIEPQPVVDTTTPIATQQTDTPIKKTAKTTRTTKKHAPVEQITPHESGDINIDTTTDEKTTIPILSVLGTTPKAVETVSVSGTFDVETENDSAPGIIDSESQSTNIQDMLADNTTPIDSHEKTLEELLESMAPLGEDEQSITPMNIDTQPSINDEPTATTDTDETLKLLATEFAESADTIATPVKTESRGKISKLKNILPFKKVKRDDSGIMGDLFGWAGVANDEDFTIPGFFANAKK